MADKRQAEEWGDMLSSVKSLHEKANSIMAPPVPDNDWSEQINKVKTSIEGLNEALNTRVQQEREEF